MKPRYVHGYGEGRKAPETRRCGKCGRDTTGDVMWFRSSSQGIRCCGIGCDTFVVARAELFGYLTRRRADLLRAEMEA